MSHDKKSRTHLKNSLELPEEHLATVAKDGSRIALYPEIASGRWRVRRTFVQYILIALFIGLPWISHNGEQLVLFDFLNQKLSLFGLTFWAHDGPILFLIVMIAVLSLALVTAVWGRVWCGWACPQTVFIEGVFRRIEALIEGNHLQRRALNAGPANFGFVFKKSCKWSLYVGISLILSHSFLAYFVGADRLIEIIQSDPQQNWLAFMVIVIATSAILFDFAMFREQFCVLVCPYGRLQSVLMDSDSLAVTYDHRRGEPRKGSATALDSKTGDCVNCFKCVSVCPTGIDIRRGLQLECINCTACMDACDSIMDKVGKKRGLIRYLSEAEIQNGIRRWLRPRPIIYATLLLVCIAAFGRTVFYRGAFHATIVRASETPYTRLANEANRVLNHFRINIKNQSAIVQKIQISLEKDSPIELVLAENPAIIAPGETRRLHFFLKFDTKLTEQTGTMKSRVHLQSDSGANEAYNFSIIGPKNVD